ncbi:MAG: hypothetical protein JXR95_14180 [Deltaproteobacteria bacterium]|nr:hypothetical protein [Deltaproteobacteria bacterium]
MFKSKYGLISAILIILVTAGAYFWVNSSVCQKVKESAVERLNRGDAMMRYIESGNKHLTLSLSNQASQGISALVNSYFGQLSSLKEVMSKQMKEFDEWGERPVFIAVVGKPHGSQNHETVYWMGVNGTDVTDATSNQWFDISDVKKLVASTKLTTGKKPVAVTTDIIKKTDKKTKKVDEKKKAAATDERKIEIPIVFPGESEGKYVAKPFEEQGISGFGGIKFTLRMHIVNMVSKKKDGTLIPVPGGMIIAGFRGSSLSKENAGRMLLKIARDKNLRLAPYTIDKLRGDIFKVINTTRSKNSFAVDGRSAHIMALIDSKGNIITRDRDDSKIRGFNYLKNYKKGMDVVRLAVSRGVSQYDVLEHEVINRFQRKSKPSNLYNGSAVPIITSSGKVEAVFLAAWPFDVRQSDASSISALKTAFFYERNIYFPTFKGTEELKDLNETLNGRFSDVTVSPLSKDSKVVIKGEKFKFAGESFIGALYQFPETSMSGKKYGYLVLVSISELKKPFSGIGTIIIILGVFALVLLFILEFFVFGYFYNSIDRVDEGVQEVTAGDTDYFFGMVSPETEGLSNSLNEMLNVLFGRETPDETGETPEKQGMQLVKMGQIPEMPYLGDDSKVAEYTNMNDAAYRQHLYAKFNAAWEKLGEEDPVPSKDLFEQRVGLYERMVLRSIECDRVYFEVTITEDSVILEPLPVS